MLNHTYGLGLRLLSFVFTGFYGEMIPVPLVLPSPTGLCYGKGSNLGFGFLDFRLFAGLSLTGYACIDIAGCD